MIFGDVLELTRSLAANIGALGGARPLPQPQTSNPSHAPASALQDSYTDSDSDSDDGGGSQGSASSDLGAGAADQETGAGLAAQPLHHSHGSHHYGQAHGSVRQNPNSHRKRALAVEADHPDSDALAMSSSRSAQAPAAAAAEGSPGQDAAPTAPAGQSQGGDAAGPLSRSQQSSADSPAAAQPPAPGVQPAGSSSAAPATAATSSAAAATTNPRRRRIRLPEELLLRILQYVSTTQPTPSETAPRKLLRHPLHAASLVSRTWNRLTNDILWRCVLIEDNSIIQFVSSVLESARFDAQRKAAAGLVSAAEASEIADMVDRRLETVREFKQLDPPPMPENNHEYTGVATSHFSLAPLDELEIRRLQNMAVIAFYSPSNMPALREVFTRRRLDVDRRRRQRMTEQVVFRPFGNGVLVRKLDMPSWGHRAALIELILEFLPNWTSVAFMHPPHGDEYIPTLMPSLVNRMRRVLSRMDTIAVEDVDEDAWIPLVHAIADNCPNVRHLNLEAIPEKDPYASELGLTYLFENVPKLECLRLDGIPIGNHRFAQYGGDIDIFTLPHYCQNLRAITLDYCDVTMGTFKVLWDECPNLEFFGMAGLTEFPESDSGLVEKPSLRTLRFVDCSVNDALIEQVARNAPNLEILRVVFDDRDMLSTTDIADLMTDATLYSIARHCRNLRVLAISACQGMTVEGFQAVLGTNPVRTLDFHKTVETDVGIITDEFLRRLTISVDNVRVINFFGQEYLSDAALIDFISSGHASSLESICLSATNISGAFLMKLLDGHTPMLERISIADCKNITLTDLLAFLQAVAPQSTAGIKIAAPDSSAADDSATDDMDTSTGEQDSAMVWRPPSPALESVSRSAALAEIPEQRGQQEQQQQQQQEQPSLGSLPLRHLKTIYVMHEVPGPDGTNAPLEHRLVRNTDTWFTDERLDIFSLWANVVRSTGCSA
ncbi:hypothetical protein HK105_203486 [Polyrhizophydium stewartii]|uniref:F-box domain-containing protein n=1 Tax=Polyrhizophydium stewartii TaxID=2732419 RepID=A0ABR4NC38_9FUNG